MPTLHKNNWNAKIKRTLCSVLPVAKNRRGKCLNCGACCKLPIPCPMLGTRPNGLSYCKIHKIKPLNCRKYPQAEHHQVTKDTCGYWFEKEK
jgi:uncharacterized protein